MVARRWWLAGVLLALVCAQALGLLHRVAHAAGAGGLELHPAAHGQQANDADTIHDANWFEALFAHTDEHGCRLFDGVAQCGAAPHPAAALPRLPAALAPVSFLVAAFVERAPAPFQARAPPASR